MHTFLGKGRGLISAFIWGALTIACARATAATIFYTNEADWVAAITNSSAFETTAAQIGLSEEVEAPTANNTDVGPTLTFLAANTGLPWSFRIATVETNAHFTYNDNEQGGTYPPYAGFEEALSIGDIDDYENDDCDILILDGPPLRGLALEVGDNDPGYADPGVSVYDTNGTLVGYAPGIPSLAGGFAFLGVVSDSAIGRVRLDADDQGDDMSIRHFRFARYRLADPQLCELALTGTNEVTIQWGAVVDWVYDIYADGSLAADPMCVASNLAAEPPTNTFTRPTGPAAEFFRVRAHLAP